MTDDNHSFVSYAHRDLSRKQIIKCAQQYDGVDMSVLIGADDSNFPFLIRSGDDQYNILFWNRSCGMMEHHDEDSVRAYAAAKYLLDHGYPVFDSDQDAVKYATEHNWPRGPFSFNDKAEQ